MTIRVSRWTWRLHHLVQLGGELGIARPAPQQVQAVADRRQGVAQLVPEQCQQLVLAARRVGQPDGILAELALAAAQGSVRSRVMWAKPRSSPAGPRSAVTVTSAQNREASFRTRQPCSRDHSLGRRGGQLPGHLAGLTWVRRLQHRDGPAEDLVGGVAREPLGAGVPGEDPTGRVEEDDAAVFHPVDQASEAFLVIGRCLLGGWFRFPVAIHDSPFVARAGSRMEPPGWLSRPRPASPGVIPRVDRCG